MSWRAIPQWHITDYRTPTSEHILLGATTPITTVNPPMAAYNTWLTVDVTRSWYGYTIIPPTVKGLTLSILTGMVQATNTSKPSRNLYYYFAARPQDQAVDVAPDVKVMLARGVDGVRSQNVVIVPVASDLTIQFKWAVQDVNNIVVPEAQLGAPYVHVGFEIMISGWGE